MLMNHDFDPYASNYQEIHNQNIKITGADRDYYSEQKVLLIKGEEEAGADGVSSILDFGCGDGNSVPFFRRHFPRAAIHGMDVSEMSLAVARERNIPNSTFSAFNGKMEPKESFDLAFMANVLHHNNPSAQVDLVRSLKESLKPGGRLYIFEHNPHNPLIRKLVRDCPFDRDAALLKPGYCRHLVEQAGFDSIEVRFILFIPRYRPLKWLLFLEDHLKWLPLGAQYYIRAVRS